MNMHSTPNQFSDEEMQLIEQHQKRSDALTEKHEAEVLNSEINNESEESRSRMLLRHASELINLSHEFLNLWIDIQEKQRKSGQDQNAV